MRQGVRLPGQGPSEWDIHVKRQVFEIPQDSKECGKRPATRRSEKSIEQAAYNQRCALVMGSQMAQGTWLTRT